MDRRGFLIFTAAMCSAAMVRAEGFDHGHEAWTSLLKKHVVLVRDGQASRIRYAGLAKDRAELKRYLASLSAVPRAAFDSFAKSQRQAFLINANNAFTIELILTKYPDLESIKDLGNLLTSPWKIKWIPLFGARVSLDDIEHDMLRRRGAYDDPRVHFAVNCASVGCPMLREEAYTAEMLDTQLDQQAVRFMSDRSRNRWNPQRGRLELSRIFDWYGEDFRSGHRGISSIEAFAAVYADRLTDVPADRERLRSSRFDIAFLDYDWTLNDARNNA